MNGVLSVILVFFPVLCFAADVKPSDLVAARFIDQDGNAHVGAPLSAKALAIVLPIVEATGKFPSYTSGPGFKACAASNMISATLSCMDENNEPILRNGVKTQFITEKTFDCLQGLKEKDLCAFKAFGIDKADVNYEYPIEKYYDFVDGLRSKYVGQPDYWLLSAEILPARIRMSTEWRELVTPFVNLAAEKATIEGERAAAELQSLARSEVNVTVKNSGGSPSPFVSGLHPMPTPTNTTCTKFGNQVQCTSY